jgi:ABC-type Fe3+/spermidine/putrescine transport system ATPase subunit
MPSTGAGVELRSLVCRYGSVEAVRALSLSIAPGEFFTLLGPSGCGKSTTLQAIGGFTVPAAGKVLVDGIDVTYLPPAARPTNYVFQSYALFPHMSVRENVEYGLKRRRVPASERKLRVDAELERVGMVGFALRRPSQLSGGQQQRVALARALVNRPKVLLLDEPLSALDFLMRKQLRDELKSIQRDVGITTIFVTHDQSEALGLSDRIAVMNGGRVEQVGRPQEIYRRPMTAFVAGFLGAANLLPGTVRSARPGEVVVDLDIGTSVVAETPGFAGGARCRVMVRPENLVLAAGGTDAGFEARLLKTTYSGDHHELAFELPGGALLVVRRPSAELPLEGLPLGQPCRLGIPPGVAHLIPAEQQA